MRMSLRQSVLFGAAVGLSLAIALFLPRVVKAEEAAPLPPRHVVIGLDISASNPLVDSDVWARRVAERIRPIIAELPFRSLVTVRTFGSYEQDNPIRFDFMIKRDALPGDVSTLIAEFVAGIPILVKNGKLQPQQTTNIIGFMQTMAVVVDCTQMRTDYILATDGYEDSDFVKLKSKNATLPAPDAPWFGGCGSLIMMGVGQGGDGPIETKRIVDAWEQWAMAAGFTDYQGLFDW